MIGIGRRSEMVDSGGSMVGWRDDVFCGLPHVLVAARYVLVVACLFTHITSKH